MLFQKKIKKVIHWCRDMRLQEQNKRRTKKKWHQKFILIFTQNIFQFYFSIFKKSHFVRVCFKNQIERVLLFFETSKNLK